MFKKLLRVPLTAWPALLHYSLSRRFTAGPAPTPELSDGELDFFLGGTTATQAKLSNSTFRFFSAADFGPDPAPETLNAILVHRLQLLGQTVDIGQPVQWRRDFHTGYEWPRAHISQLQLATTLGDVKVPWELSRFQHGLTLARGYAATRDERYAAVWASQFQSWRADNPPEHGPNWGNAMEAAIRAVNWIAAHSIFRSGGATFDSALSESFLKALIQHGRFIFNHLEHYWPPTNHILADLCGLIWIGVYLKPESKNERALPESKRWLTHGLHELSKQLRLQILPDGASYEASTAYHRFVTEMVASTLRLCELNSVFTPPFLSETVAKMEAVVETLRKPNGALPLFGDEDGGQWLAPSPAPLAQPGQGRLTRVSEGWRTFGEAGWFVHRKGGEYLAIRAGDNGQGGWGGHAHNDALSFEFSIGWRDFLVDPGTYTYTADPDSRNLFRSTAYHNTLRVDRQEISRIPSGELFRLESEVKVRCQLQNGTWKGEHNGYSRLGITHARCFEEQESGWHITDTLTGRAEHTLEWFFHFAPDSPVKVDGLKIWTTHADGPNLSLTAHHPFMSCDLQSGWVSPTYGQRLPAPVVRYALLARLPLTVTFIINLG